MKTTVIKNYPKEKSDYKKRQKLMKRKRDLKRVKNSSRYALVVYLVFGGLLSYIVWNLFGIMVLDREGINEKNLSHGVRKVEVKAQRGKINDRYGNPLAENYNVYHLELDVKTLFRDIKADTIMDTDNMSDEEKAKLSDIQKKEKEVKLKEILGNISDILGLDKATVQAKFMQKNSKGEYSSGMPIARKVKGNKADEVKKYMSEQKVGGLIPYDDSKRMYRYDSLASTVIGHVNQDGVGLNGVEAYYNNLLNGTNGIKYYNVDAENRLLPQKPSFETPPIKGNDINLTVDYVLQNEIEKIAEEALIENKAKKISIMVMNPKTGEILALANKPDYNLNEPFAAYEGAKEGEVPFEVYAQGWKNRAVNDSFEPGSIYKPFTAYAALKEGVTSTNEVMDTLGYVDVLGTRIYNWDKQYRKNENMKIALKESSNTYFVEMARRLGRERMSKYIDLFGFGKKTGTDMAGESSGIVKSLDSMSEVDLATIAFGQTNTMTMVQYMRAFNAIVNGGYMITPHIVKSVTDNNGNETQEGIEVFEKEKVLDESVCNTIIPLLEYVAENSKAYIEGYRMIGKTGTAQKPDYEKGGYKDNAYISSMAAAAPADDPQVSVMVSIDEPGGGRYYAGQIITPITKKVMLETFQQLSKKNNKIYSVVQSTLNLPDVYSETTENAKKILQENELNYEIIGGGKYVSHTKPEPGTMVQKGRVVKVFTFN